MISDQLFSFINTGRIMKYSHVDTIANLTYKKNKINSFFKSESNCVECYKVTLYVQCIRNRHYTLLIYTVFILFAVSYSQSRILLPKVVVILFIMGLCLKESIHSTPTFHILNFHAAAKMFYLKFIHSSFKDLI